jgi:hypothetical protein
MASLLLAPQSGRATLKMLAGEAFVRLSGSLPTGIPAAENTQFKQSLTIENYRATCG